MKQFRMLARLELINIFGLNEFKYMKDPQGRRRKGLNFLYLVCWG